MTRILAMVLTAALTAGAATAQETSTNRVDEKTDWSVFVDSDPTECWAVSAPKETVNTRDGRVVAVRRGDILMLVFNRPSASVTNQINFVGGYPFASGSTVNVNVDGTEFELFTEGETAWTASPTEDAQLVTAMKRGSRAVVTGRSGRGTTTQDTFSLLGFTAAVEDAERRCAG
ncbi:MAG: invasion associated locus B family protein [Shimia sp.]